MRPDGSAAERIDATRRQAAEAICDRVIGRVRDWRYVPPEALWAESTAYRAELAATLAIAGHLLGRQRCMDVAEAMLERILAERVDGALWSVGRWCTTGSPATAGSPPACARRSIACRPAPGSGILPPCTT